MEQGQGTGSGMGSGMGTGSGDFALVHHGVYCICPFSTLAAASRIPQACLVSALLGCLQSSIQSLSNGGLWALAYPLSVQLSLL